MFLSAIDEHHEWFRFHHLFRDLLRYRLRARHPDDEARIVSAAAEWFVQQGDVSSAIECFLHARAWDRAIDLILARGREVYERGQATSVAQWLGAVPETDRTARPSAEALYGIVARHERPGGARPKTSCGDCIARPGWIPASADRARVHLRARRSSARRSRVSIAAANESLRMLRARPDVSPRSDRAHRRSLLETHLARSRSAARTCSPATCPKRRRVLRLALESPGAQYSVYRVHLLGSLALLEAWSGRLVVAQKLADEALQLARDVGLLVHPAPADAYLALSLVAIHRGQAAGRRLRPARGRRARRVQSRVRSSCGSPTSTCILAGEASRPETSRPGRPAHRAGCARCGRHRARRLAGETVAIPPDQRAWSPLLVESRLGMR